MRVKYDPGADILIMVLREEPPADAVEEPGGVVVSYGSDGEPVSVEIMGASRRGLLSDGHLSVTLDSGGEAEGVV